MITFCLLHLSRQLFSKKVTLVRFLVENKIFKIVFKIANTLAQMLDFQLKAIEVFLAFKL